MTGLKTLKDIVDLNNDWEESSQKAIYEDLKVEAIKWIKIFEDRPKGVVDVLVPASLGKGKFTSILINKDTSNWIKHFFNITEEDLK